MMLGIPLLGYDELVRDLAISADITRRGWKNLGYDNLTPIPAEEAGKQFCDIFQQNDLTMFEYFLTDHAGHSQSMSMAVEILEDLDRFLDGMLESFECDRSLLIITSDHGNIEDLSTKTHTFNPVPVILAGAGRDQIAPKIKCISDVVPSLMEFLLKFN
jgi:bisphosphoglycerate-independent phosphoglycerate mutase (AlkP superfamily)